MSNQTPIPPDLMYALLAMDSYNRGYAQGLFYGDSSVGIGDATVITETSKLKDPNDPNSFTQEFKDGFFAVAYDLSGQKIISYRGTDHNSAYDNTYGGSDFYNGYGIGFGDPVADGDPIAAFQAFDAINFYQAIVGTAGKSNIVQVGHSLGGGIAGFIAAIYGLPADIFDNMPFNDAAARAFLLATTGTPITNERIPQGESWTKYLYGDSSPVPSDYSGIVASEISGQFLQLLTDRFLLPPIVFQTPQPTVLDPHASPLALTGTFSTLHSMAHLDLLIYASDNAHTDWYSIGDYLVSAYFNDRIGQAIGVGQTPGVDSFSGKMLTEIAYSALTEGSTPFGTQGIQSLFTDADTLGKFVDQVLKKSDFTDVLSKSIFALQALADVIVQYAGDVASTSSTDSSFGLGVLNYDKSNNVLKVNFDPSKWISTTANSNNIIGRNELLEIVLAPAAGESPIPIPDAPISPAFLQSVYNIASNTTEMEFAGGSGVSTLSDANIPTTSQSQPGTVVMVGGSGTTTYNIGSGSSKDIILAGSGKNIIDYSQDNQSNLKSILIEGQNSGGNQFNFNYPVSLLESTKTNTFIYDGAGGNTYNFNIPSSSSQSIGEHPTFYSIERDKAFVLVYQ